MDAKPKSGGGTPKDLDTRSRVWVCEDGEVMNIKWGIICWDPVFLDEAEEQVKGVI